MTKYEFLGELSKLLSDIPEEERNQAMIYYEDYFADAGVENEQKVIEELGSPERLASIIRKDTNGEDTVDEKIEGKSDKKKDIQGVATDGKRRTFLQWLSDTFEEIRENTGQLVIFILLLILLAPALLSLVGGVISGVIGIVCAMFGVMIGFVLGGVITAIVGIVLVVGGIAKLVAAPFMAILAAGSGLMAFAVGAALFFLGIWLGGKVYPLVFKSVANFFKREFVMGTVA